MTAGVRTVLGRLRAERGPFVPKQGLQELDELIATVLSQHTSDRNSEAAFASLKARYPRWEDVLTAPAGDVADAIRRGGIADQKTVRIRRILATVAGREGALDLSRLRTMTDGAARDYLTSLPGVGPKTAACVLLFSMGRPAFPVDTHVHRIAARLGWIPPGIAADRAHELLERRVPPALRYELHLALIAHGRNICHARRPACGGCVLRRVCPSAYSSTANSVRTSVTPLRNV